MCGRFTLTTNDYRAVAEALEAEIEPDVAEAYRPRWNVAPGDRHLVLTASGDRRRLVPATWGLPGDHASRPQGHINARSETAHARPAFRDAFRNGRCAIPADGFYEWVGPRDRRLPVWYHAPSGVIALAGLYTERVDSSTGEVTLRFAILTTAANELVAPVHDRMPVILSPDALARWLRPIRSTDAIDPIDELRALLEPAPDDVLVATEVSSRANSVAHDDPACVAPSAHPHQTSLF